MLLHVDNLRRSYEREHTELEETKRVLIEHKLLVVRISFFFSSLFLLIEHDLLVVRISFFHFLLFFPYRKKYARGEIFL